MPASSLTKKPFAPRVRASSVKVIAENRDATLKQFRELKAQRSSGYATRSVTRKFREQEALSKSSRMEIVKTKNACTSTTTTMTS